MKKYILVLLMLVSPLIAQENTKKISPPVNNALKFYLMGGLPTGIGLTYTAEFRSRPTSPTIHALSFDMQFIAIEYTPIGIGVIGGDFGLQYSIGSLLPSGAHFYVDLIGLGVDVQYMGIYFPYPFYSVKLLGFQYTSSNGFYWGLRSKLTISTSNPFTVVVDRTPTTTYYIDETKIGFGAYLAIGYDFGKKINPKDYEPRPMLVRPVVAQDNSLPVNNALKFYLMAGLPAGIGLTYTAEFRSRPTSPTIHALSIDMQFSAIECTALGPNLIGGKFGLQYSIGSLLPSGARFYVDLIGLGVDVMGMEFPHPFYSVKLLGFQYTTSNGFYWGIRSALSISTFVSIIENSRVGSLSVSTKVGTIPRTDVGFGAYLALGYDFGKKINPKDYEPRPR